MSATATTCRAARAKRPVHLPMTVAAILDRIAERTLNKAQATPFTRKTGLPDDLN